MLQGAVLCLAQAAQLLFSGGQDTTIKVWGFDAASQAFQPLVSSLQRSVQSPLAAKPACNCMLIMAFSSD